MKRRRNGDISPFEPTGYILTQRKEKKGRLIIDVIVLKFF